MKKQFLVTCYVAALLAMGAAAVELFLRPSAPAAERLTDLRLLENLHGYLKAGRFEEAMKVLESLRAGGGGGDYLDQAGYEVAKAYVEAGKGDQALPLLDAISLHDRSFDFQLAVLREKLRALYPFFFDPSGDLRTPAQPDDFVFHSKLNPDEKLRIRNPQGFDDPHKLLEYFNAVTRQLEDILAIQGKGKEAEPFLAEGYDAIQILLYGRGLIKHGELLDRLDASPAGRSPRTLYLLGNQYFVEADYGRALPVWGRLVKAAPEDENALRAFTKAFELFECRRLLANAFAFWPLERPAWLDELAAREPFKTAANGAAARLAAHQDLAKYAGVAVLQAEPRDVLERKGIPKDEPSAPSDEPTIFFPEASRGVLILQSVHELGWRLQTEFREFSLKREDAKIFSPANKITVQVQSCYHGEIALEARRFADGGAYRKFAQLPPRQAVQAAANLSVVKTWFDDLGPLAQNGTPTTRSLIVPLNAPGFYLVTARVRYAPVVAVTQVAIVAEKVLTWASPEGVLFRVVDRDAGRPLAGARILGTIRPHYDLAAIAPKLHDGSRPAKFLEGLSAGFNEGKRDELVTDNNDFRKGFAEGLSLRKGFPLDPEPFEAKTAADGTVFAAVPEKWKGVRCEFKASPNDLGDVCPIDVFAERPAENKPWQALFYAERPIFQPGEKARVKGILRRLDAAGPVLPEDEDVEFMLWHRERLYGIVRARPNQAGTVALELPLPIDASLGAYHLTVGHEKTRYPVFRVDRGERPLVEVSVKADQELAFMGSTLRGRARAMRFGNVAAVGLPIRVKVLCGPAPETPKPSDPREDFFEPVALKEYPDADDEELQRSRTWRMSEVWTAGGLTDANGEFAWSFDSDPKTAHRYRVVVEVDTLPQRKDTASTEVLTYDLPLFLEIKPERTFYYPGETLRAEVFTRALDGRAVPATLRLEVGRDGDDPKAVETIKTDKDGRAHFAVQLGNAQVAVRVGVQGAAGWVYREVPHTLRQMGVSAGGGGLILQLDRKAYYPGETARVTLQSTHPGLDVLLTVSREKVRLHQSFALQGVNGVYDLPVDEAGAPNLFLHAVAVADDQVITAVVEVPVIPAQKFLKLEIETDREDYAAGAPVAATVKVRDWKDRPVAGAELSLAAVLSTAFVMQEDLTPDLARYFLNNRLPLWVRPGSAALLPDKPREDAFWLSAVFAWGLYKDLVYDSMGVGHGGGGGGRYGGRYGGRENLVARGGGSFASVQDHLVDAYADFLRQHGLTLFYEARLVTGADGAAKVDFLLPAGSGEFRFTARAVTPETLIGEIRCTVRFRQDVALQAPWPVLIHEGDHVQTPVFVVNNTDRVQKGMLTVTADLPVALAGPAEVEVAPRGVARVDFELDARALPGGGGYEAPLTYAHFTAAFTPAGGAKAVSEAMIPVERRGIVAERRVVALARAGGGPEKVRFLLEDALPGSVRLQVRPMAGPKEVVKWLLEDLKLRSGGQHYAWAAEVVAPRLTPAEIKEGKSIPVEAPLMAALTQASRESHTPYLMTVASASRRGVHLPPACTEEIAQGELGRANQSTSPRDCWALAEYYAGRGEETGSRVAQLLRSLGDVHEGGRTLGAYQALGFQAIDRKTAAAECLDQALAGTQARRRERFRDLSLEESAALLLAGTRVGLDDETLGGLYGAVLDSLARTPQPGAWPAALAVHALDAWGRRWRAPEGAVRASLNGRELEWDKGGGAEAFPPAGAEAVVAVAPPAEGTVAVEVTCSFRLSGEGRMPEKGCQLERRFARLDREGRAALLLPGEPVRLGETLLMILESSGPGGGWLLTVPHAGPWEGVPQVSFREPSRRVRREFVLSPGRRERVLAAAEERRFADARAEIVEAVRAGDYLEETEGEEAKERSLASWIALAPLAGRPRFSVRNGGVHVLAFKPDRTGDFFAPAAWLNAVEGGLPLAAADSFPFRVVEADAVIPARPSELKVREDIRTAAVRALALVPDETLRDFLKEAPVLLDVLPLVMAGLFTSPDPQAADAYAALFYPSGARSLVTLEDLFNRRAELLKTEKLRAIVEQNPSHAVFSRVLEGRDLPAFLADNEALDKVVKWKDPAERTQLAVSFMEDVSRLQSLERECQVSLLGMMRQLAWKDEPAPRFPVLKEVLAGVAPASLEILLDALDGAEGGAARAVRGPSLKAALESWAGGFGFVATFDPGVPDLEGGEFVLSLPLRPSFKVLNAELAGLGLCVRRDGRKLLVSPAPRSLALDPDLRKLLKAKDAPERLAAWLAQPPAANSLEGLLALVTARTQGGYTPRMEASHELIGCGLFQSPLFDLQRPLSEQLPLLAARGVRLEVAGGVLRIGTVK